MGAQKGFDRTMNISTSHARMMHRFEATQTPLGRWWLNGHVSVRRWMWRTVMTGGHVAKRAFDIAASLAFLTAFSPLYLLAALLVKLEDGGPVFFTQVRVGQFGREFKFYKFRSMCVDAEARLKEVLARNQHQQGVTFKMKDDPRLTRIGKRLRRFSLDELPQFFNVLIGDMSIVGPRPPVPREVALYSLEDRRRLAVKPGITCLWQIGGRSEIDFSGQVQLDVKYIEEQNLWRDVGIMVKTVPAVLSGRGAC
jgi:lipopolysaccharide/colanic/teichoic acid biosynthesis glycosyltransferase